MTRQDLKAQLVKTQELLQLAVKEKENTQKIIEVCGEPRSRSTCLFFSSFESLMLNQKLN